MENNFYLIKTEFPNIKLIPSGEEGGETDVFTGYIKSFETETNLVWCFE